jgi:HSP20 family protein
MSQVQIQRISEPGAKPAAIFEEMAKRWNSVRERAFDLFEKRGCELGHALEDWLKAEREVCGWPAAELTEKSGAYELEIALPGFDPKEVEVTATPQEIFIHAASKTENSGEKGKVIWSEYGSNDVYRHFALPQPIAVEKATAKLDKGILRISAPQSAKPKSKPIEVMAAA